MTIDISHVEASIRRFNKTAIILAARATGVPEEELNIHPVIVSKENYIWAITESKGKTDSDFYTPYIVNASFCLEILIKSIIFYERDEWVHGHNLVNLYSELSNNIKKEINESFKKNHKPNHLYKEALKLIKHEASINITWNVAALLDRASNAFENWRYAFDKNKQKSCFIGYDELYKVLTEAKEKTVLTRHSS